MVPISRMPFPENEYKSLAKSGTAIIKGRAFLKTSNDIKVAPEKEIILNPVTSYSNEWYEKRYIHGEPLVNPDPRIYNYLIKTITDESGRFTFMNVPAGEYYVTTSSFWDTSIDY